MKLMPVYQVGKGLSKDEKAQKLALQHWLEAVLIVLIAFLVYPLFNEIKKIHHQCFFFWFTHEKIDPRHRYGHNLHFYYDSWLHCESKQPFFYWYVITKKPLITPENININILTTLSEIKKRDRFFKHTHM
jgi:hypothetical protein